MKLFALPFPRLPVLDRWLILLGTVMMGAALVELTVRALEDRRPPINIDRVVTLNSPLAAGDALQVRVFRTKVRSCPVHSTRYIVDADGRYRDVYSVTSEGGPVDTDYVDVHYPLDADLPPGAYELKVSLAYHCTDGVHVIEQPNAKFRVKE